MKVAADNLRSRARSSLALATAGVVLLAALVLSGTATGVGQSEALPDLVSDAPANPYLETYLNAGSSTPRLLLRFDGFVHNRGAGPLEIAGSDPSSQTMQTVVQRIFDPAGIFVRADGSLGPSMIYEDADGHHHWHLRSAMRYGLYDAAKLNEVAPSQKAGFCLGDSQKVAGEVGPASKVYVIDQPGQPSNFCGQFHPTIPQVTMGVSPGWRDLYPGRLAYQWVDVSNVLPGSYWLAASSDPENVVVESDETNNGVAFAASPVVIPGFLAQPVAVPGAVPGKGLPVSLGVTSFTAGSPQALTFKIVKPPADGRLDQVEGQAFTSPVVTYTPSSTFPGSDSFTYIAFDANSEFPRAPVEATVTVTGSVAPPTVVIAGAPANVVTGTSTTLTANVVGDPPAVTWRVDGVLGGTAASGLISSTGTYTAPAAPPPGGTVTVRASSARAAAEVTITIVAPSPPLPAPDPVPPAGTGTAGSSTPAPPVETPSPSPQESVLSPPVPTSPPLLLAPTLARKGRLLVIGAESGTPGTIEISAWKGSSRLGRCLTRTPARHGVTCQILVRRGLPVVGLRVSVRLLVRGKAVARKLATFSRELASYRGSGLECWLSVRPVPR